MATKTAPALFLRLRNNPKATGLTLPRPLKTQIIGGAKPLIICEPKTCGLRLLG
jgi:hypothetical protein